MSHAGPVTVAHCTQRPLLSVLVCCTAAHSPGFVPCHPAQQTWSPAPMMRVKETRPQLALQQTSCLQWTQGCHGTVIILIN